jgi:phosphoglycolate phosphatase
VSGLTGKPLALFDCDGTLIDSQHDIVEAMNRAFDSVKMVHPARNDVLSIIGLSLPQAMARLLPDAESDFHDHLSDQYKQAFQTMRRENGVGEPLFPGMAELITTLADSGWQLGVATGKSDRGLNICLTNHGIIHRFVTLQTADRHPSKPHPAMAHAAMVEACALPETTVMIGDTSFDMEMAVNAGIRAIGVDWGYHSADELIASGAVAVARNTIELAHHIGMP